MNARRTSSAATRAAAIFPAPPAAVAAGAPRQLRYGRAGTRLLTAAMLALIPLALIAVIHLVNAQLDSRAAIAGLTVGALVGLTGMGSGALMTPVLILIVGVPPVTAVGTDLAYASLTKLVGGVQHARLRTVDFRLVRLFALGSVPASLASVQALELLRRRYAVDTIDDLVKRALGCILILAALILTLGFVRAHRVKSELSSTRRPLAAGPAIALGATIGVLVGMTSVGSGSIMVAVLSLLSPLPAGVLVGTDVAHAAVLTSAAAIAHGLAGNVDLDLLLSLLTGSLPGVLLGSRLSVRVPPTVLRTILALVLLLTGAKLL